MQYITQHTRLSLLFAAFAVLALSACDSSGPAPPENSALVANAGADLTADVGALVSLDGSASSDTDGDELTFAWSLTASPSGSAATLHGAETATPRFTPDAAGTYELELTVSDGTDSATDVVSVTVNDFPFNSWHQGFEGDASGWITNATSGAAGWCGAIEQRTGGGAVAPSAGGGYAVVTHGACNAYWSSHGFPNGSGPYSPGAGYSSVWPNGGFVIALDIYLNPSMAAGPDSAVFTYSSSIDLLDKEYPANFRYFLVPVTAEEGRLLVAGHEVTEAGWYTFCHTFGSESGNLAIDFELVRDGQTLFTEAVTETSFTGEATSSFAVSNVSNGYAWFVSIADGLGLAIDKHAVHRSNIRGLSFLCGS